MIASISGCIRREWFLGISIATSLICLLFGGLPLGDLSFNLSLGLTFLWLFGAVLGSGMSVVRHADHLAARLGEPYGTLILTLSVTFIEVICISAVMLHGLNNPTLARDTLFAVIMIVLNGMVGLSLIVGGWRHREQHYNLQGANAYLGVIIPLVVLTLVLPDFTLTTPGPTLSVGQQAYLVVIALGLYATFLVMQTGRHRRFFSLEAGSVEHLSESRHGDIFSHAILLVAYMAPVVVLAEQLARPVDYLIETLHAPIAFGGVIMAVLVATPEAIGAVSAAMQNDLQRSVNIFLGSVLSTIGITVPAMVLVSHLTGREITLGVEHTDLVMLLLTLTVSVVTFASGRTNVIQGAVHLMLFATYLALVVQG